MTHVAVIGAGIVGAATAHALLDAGHQVTILEPETPGGRQAASFGNGAWISPASIIPMSMPGLWRKVPGYLLNKNGPLTMRWRDLLAMAPWLLLFLRAGASFSQVDRTAGLLAQLLHDAPQRHAALAQQAGCAELIRQQGLLYAFPDRAAFDAEGLSWELRRRHGVAWRELNGDEIQALEPSLSRRYGFAALVESGAHCVDPGAYVGAIVADCLRRGARLKSVRAQDFVVRQGKMQAVVTSEGELACDYAVISAGIWSKALAARAGDRVPLHTERGYHSVIHNPRIAPQIPVMPSDGKMANTLTASGLRLSGQVELASVDAKPDWNRAEILLRHALASYEGLGRREELEVTHWLGHRPSTADGLPVIGRSARAANIVHAFGHGHVGLASGPVTAALVTRLIVGQAEDALLSALTASRFA